VRGDNARSIWSLVGEAGAVMAALKEKIFFAGKLHTGVQQPLED